MVTESESARHICRVETKRKQQTLIATKRVWHFMAFSHPDAKIHKLLKRQRPPYKSIDETSDYIHVTTQRERATYTEYILFELSAMWQVYKMGDSVITSENVFHACGILSCVS